MKIAYSSWRGNQHEEITTAEYKALDGRDYDTGALEAATAGRTQGYE